MWWLMAEIYSVSSTGYIRVRTIKLNIGIDSDGKYLYIFWNFWLSMKRKTNRLRSFHRRDPSSKSPPIRLSRATTWVISPKFSFTSRCVVAVSIGASCPRPTISISGAGEDDWSLRESSYLSQGVVVRLMEPPLVAEDALSPLLRR